MSTSAENRDYKQLYEAAIRQNNELTQKIEQLQHELSQLKKMIFGVRQERFIPADKNQLTLDIALEQSVACNVLDARKVTYIKVSKEQINQGRDVRHTIPAHLRREDVILEPDAIPEGSKHIGSAETEVLEYKPAEIYVVRYIRNKYLTPSPDETSSKIIIAPLPTNDGKLHLDNNSAERSIRATVIGRKNYLFAGSHESAKRIALLYSLIGTCKLHNVNPSLWLKQVLTVINDHPINRIKELLPHIWITKQK